MSATDEEQPPSTPAVAGFGGIPIISSEIVLAELPWSDLEDYVAQAKDLYCSYFPASGEPDDTRTVPDGLPMVLLAKNVSSEHFKEFFLPIKARYFLDDNNDLYIRKVSGRCQAAVHSHVNFDCGNWELQNESSSRSIGTMTAPIETFGDKKLEPDVGVYVESCDGQWVPRCVIELEVSHRSPVHARRMTNIYFQNPNVNVVILLKVWPRRQDNTFAAACVVWIRGDGRGFACRAAHDFGTAAIDQQALSNLSGLNETPDAAPFVPVGMQYTPPLPGRPIDGRQPQIVEVPANQILVNMPNAQGEQLVNIAPPIPSLRLHLSRYAAKIEDMLPVNQGTIA